jgi:hypothetical protein
VDEAEAGEDKNKEKGLASPRAGEYVAVRVTGCTTGSLIGECLGRTTLGAFHAMHGGPWVEKAGGATAAQEGGVAVAGAR